MNIRVRQQIRAITKLRTVEPIMATLADEQDPRWHKIAFFHPDDWEDAKRVYGDRLKKLA